MKVNSAHTAPAPSMSDNALQGPSPLVRRMVYSELCASRAMTNTHPINTAIGNSSYRWLGTSSATYSSAWVSW